MLKYSHILKPICCGGFWCCILMICCYKCFYTSEFIFSTEQSPAQTCGLWTTDSPPESPSGPQVDLVKYNVFLELCATLIDSNPLVSRIDVLFLISNQLVCQFKPYYLNWLFCCVFRLQQRFATLPAQHTVFTPFFFFFLIDLKNDHYVRLKFSSLKSDIATLLSLFFLLWRQQRQWWMRRRGYHLIKL